MGIGWESLPGDGGGPIFDGLFGWNTDADNEFAGFWGTAVCGLWGGRVAWQSIEIGFEGGSRLARVVNSADVNN